MDQCAPWFPIGVYLAMVVGMIYLRRFNDSLASNGFPQSIAGVVSIHQIFTLADIGLMIMFVGMAISNGSCSRNGQIAWLVTGGFACVRLLRRFIDISSLIN